jgi:hypothetical protein
MIKRHIVTMRMSVNICPSRAISTCTQPGKALAGDTHCQRGKRLRIYYTII